MADSRTQPLYGALNPSTLDNYGAFQSSGDQTDSRNKPLYGALDPSTLDNYGATKTYSQLLETQQSANQGVTTGSPAEWSAAWKSMQIDQMKKNIPREDHTDPTPLLIDTISALPADSDRRRSAENLKNTIDGIATNIGTGLDNLTRESYKEVKRLIRCSSMLLNGIQNNAIPSQTQMFGIEEGLQTSNLQHWKTFFTNAVKPVSDALGSHADTDHSIIKDAAGVAAFIPLAAVSLLDKTVSFIVDETEGIFKHHQLEIMQHLPSKMVGSLRQLSTALDDILSVPFEIMSDVYNGLMELMNEISNLIDKALAKIMEFFTKAGGLLDSIFPEGMLQDIMDTISDVASELGGIFDLLGGFPAMAKIGAVLSVVSGGFANILKNLPYLYTLLRSKTQTITTSSTYDCVTEIFELSVTKFPRIPKVLQILSAIGGVIGSSGSLGKGLGNLGAMIAGGISSLIGSVTLNIRNLAGMLANLLPAAIGAVLEKLLGKLCNLGMVGNLGYSIGNVMDFIKDSAFSKAMSKFATHHLIVAPLFGKEVIPKGAYSQESALSRFTDSVFAIGSQGNKGVTMIAPGGSIRYRPFASLQGSFSIGEYSFSLAGNSTTIAL